MKVNDKDERASGMSSELSEGTRGLHCHFSK